jgi:hypothetical protein
MEINEKIKREFVAGWDSIEDTFKSFNLAQTSDILALIKEMRSKGFDQTFRAGSALYSLVLSRSKQYGLRPDQKSVRFDFEFIQQRVMDVTDKDRVTISFDKIEYNDTIERVLLDLAKEQID